MQFTPIFIVLLGVVTTEVSALQLTADNGKMTSRGAYRNNGRFAGWVSTSLEVFWDIEFARTGILNISFSIGNVDYEKGAVFEIKLGNNQGNQTIQGVTTSSGDYSTPKLMPMGTINVAQTGKQRLTVKAVTIPGGVAGDLYYVSLTGPASANARVVDVYQLQPYSTHLTYEDSDYAQMYYNDVIVTSSIFSTYISAIAFDSGYFGIQEKTGNNGQTEKLAIFSLWDNVDTEKVTPNPDELASVFERGTNVNESGFGGEGTGKKTMWPLNWQIGQKVQFLLTVKAMQDGYVHYTGFVYHPTLNNWKLMAVLRRKEPNHHLTGYYSFLEDWEGGWGHVAREASFNPWVRNANGDWIQPTKATFTSSNIQTINRSNLNGWAKDGRFYMRTGGNTTNTAQLNNNTVERTVTSPVNVLPKSLTNIDNVIKSKSYIK